MDMEYVGKTPLSNNPGGPKRLGGWVRKESQILLSLRGKQTKEDTACGKQGYSEWSQGGGKGHSQQQGKKIKKRNWGKIISGT